MKQYYLLPLLCLTITGIFAQGVIPPSPDALGLAKYANIPVSHYTGTPAINIPLAQVGGKELSVPVSLSYNASGHKVQEMASSVGLGWSLNAGGVITRMVRGLPDDLENGYCGVNNVGEKANNPNNEYYENVEYGVWDGEPDLFFFNFMGKSGKFVLDATGQPVLLPFQNIIIKPGICLYNSNTWEITDENGVKYIFGETANERETTASRKVTQNVNQQISYVTSWYLSEVISPNETENVTFQYISSSVSNTFYNFKHSFYHMNGNTCWNHTIDESIIVTINTKHIAMIQGKLGYIQFSWLNGREDITTGKMLSQINIYNLEHNLIEKYKYEYGYFQSNNCSSSLCKRLKLIKIYDRAPDPLYSFTYNTLQNLPSIDSKSIDHWGFYNASGADSWLAAYSDSNIVFDGVNKAPHQEAVKANLINRIDYRGGGYQQFEFEAHNAWKNNTNEIVGGVRIREIVESTQEGFQTIRNFNYHVDGNENRSSGLLYRKPIYGYSVTGEAVNIEGKSGFPYTIAFRFSHSLTDTYDISGTHVGYSRVEEKVQGIGSTVNYFTNFDSNPDQLPSGNLVNPDAPPFVPYSSEFWERGNPLMVTSLDNNGNLIGKQINEFNFNLPDKTLMKGTGTLLQTGSCGYYTRKMYYAQYNIISRPLTLTRQTTETYDPANVNKKRVQITDYEYDPVTYQPVKTYTYNQADPNTKYISQTKFVTDAEYNYPKPGECENVYSDCMALCDSENDSQIKANCQNGCSSDYSACITSEPPHALSAAVVKLRTRNQINTPVESIQLLQMGGTTKVLSSSLNLFEKTGNLVLLKETRSMSRATDQQNYLFSKVNVDGSFSYDNNLKTKITYNSYDASANLLQQTDYTGISNTYTWFPNKLPQTAIQTAVGLTPRQISYTHKPLVGQTQVTDPNGVVTKYEYDVYNRPAVVRDGNNNILKRTRYHYKNETPGFVITQSKKQAITNELITFTATDIAASVGGTPRFVWDMGDGTVVDNNSTSVQHSYTTPGMYTVKLSGVGNFEYGPVTRTTQITVYEPLQASICATGKVAVDMCGVNQPITATCEGDDPPPQYGNQVTFKVTKPLNGCPINTFTWRWRNVNHNVWNNFGLNSGTVVFTPFGLGSYEIECTITDACGQEQVLSGGVSYYQSQQNCANQIIDP